MNRATLTGRLTADIKLRHTKTNNTPVTTFSMAVDRGFVTKNGKRMTDFPRVTVWRKSAQTLDKYGGKGSLIGIDGRTETSSYTNKDNKRVYVQEIVADSVELLNTKPKGQSKSDKNIGSKANDIEPGDDDLPF